MKTPSIDKKSISFYNINKPKNAMIFQYLIKNFSQLKFLQKEIKTI